jgi:hypothetical protein
MPKNIIRWLKKYFIPHEHNDHRPHILRARATIVLLSIALLIEAGFLAQVFFFSQSGLFATILRNVLIDITNNSRQSENLISLTENPLLGIAATMKAQDMAEKGYFAHTSPEGIDPWHWIEKVGYQYRYAGENLAVNFSESGDVVKAWLNSPAHRRNIFDRRFTEIGIGTATGTYDGRATVFIVQIFGTPVVKPAPASIPAVTIFQGEAVAASATPAVTLEAPIEVLGTTDAISDGNIEQSGSLSQLAVSSPREVSDYLYAALMAIIAIALILSATIKTKFKRPSLILNGLVMLLIINTLLIANHYLMYASGIIF